MLKVIINKCMFVIFVSLITSPICVSSETILNSESYSPHVSHAKYTNVYWGDTHVHTNLSTDAYNFGNRNLGPDDAYRFAMGQTVIANNGMAVRLNRPLDFLVIADHAENIGVMQGLEIERSDLLSSPTGRKWGETLKRINRFSETDIAQSVDLSLELFVSTLFGETNIVDGDYLGAIWREKARKSDLYNKPGEFTAFTGYEWTSSLSLGLHRVVIFKDGADKVTQVVPFSRSDSADPEDLWSYFSDYEENTEGEVIAIPHNSNISGGAMFALEDAKGNPLSLSYANTRNRWEPLVEITQIKGDSETHPLLSTEDEFADFERVSSPVQAPLKDSDVYASWVNSHFKRYNNPGEQLERYNYVRSALKLGLREASSLGANPFKFGVIGSTDSHTSLATGDEDNFFGKLSYVEPYPERMLNGFHGPYGAKNESPPWSMGWKMNAAGYAAVWAEENTRESLFAAMKRKEVYASTGPRITVRFFGGWDYQGDDAFKPTLAKVGYAQGVPMGGDLAAAPDGRSPRFLIRAVKDPDGANLDRVQIIKGWHDTNGELHEKIYDVALSDERKPNWRGKVKPVGNTVDVADASYTNTIGDPELAVVWEDPDFAKDELAFYYVRVLEIPTPRWTAYDAKYFGLKDIPKEIPMVTQERAYTSPIWYSPK